MTTANESAVRIGAKDSYIAGVLFPKSHSTEHAILAITDSIYKSIDKGGVCVLISFDFASASPSVDREVLMQEIKLNTFSDFFRGRK